MQIQVYRGIQYTKNPEFIQDIFQNIRLIYRGVFCRKNNSTAINKNNFEMCYRGTSYKKN